MSEKDVYKEKFRPEADPSIEAQVDAAIAGLSTQELGFEQPPKPEGEPAEQLAPGIKRGKIVAVTAEEVFVDLGGKSPGFCPITQFETEPAVGEEHEFHVDHYDTREGILVLTKKGAVAENVSWENLEIGQLVEGEVTGMNKGGLELKVKSMRAFMPSGQVDIVFHKDISTFIGQRMQAEVTQYDKATRNLILSRRNILEREKEENKKKLLAELQEGQVRRGTVRTVMDYGAFVDLGGIDGLLHVSEMSHRRIRNPNELVKEGDMVDVKITKIDPATGKLSLSLKQAMADPWVDAQNRYAPGTMLTARVARVENFGAFVEVEEGIEGLLPASEMSWQRIRHPNEVVKEGETVKVVVLNIEPGQRRLTFSIKQAGGDPWANVDNYPVNAVINGKVTRTADFGAFVELEPGLEGLIHISELSNQRVRAASDVVKPGQEVQVRVIDVDKEKRRVGLSMKRVAEPVKEEPPKPQLSPKELEKKAKKRAQLRGGLDF